MSTKSKTTTTKSKAKENKALEDIVAPEASSALSLFVLAARKGLESEYEPISNAPLFDSLDYVMNKTPEEKKSDPRKPYAVLNPAARSMIARFFTRIYEELKELPQQAIARLVNINISGDELQRIIAASKGDPMVQANLTADALFTLRSAALGREADAVNSFSLLKWATDVISKGINGTHLKKCVYPNNYFNSKMHQLLQTEATSILPGLATDIYINLLKKIAYEVACDLWVEHSIIKSPFIHRFMMVHSVPEMVLQDILSYIPEAKPKTTKVTATTSTTTSTTTISAPAPQVTV